ncbi:chorismate synthase, partial [Helicosporidium sp. ATCC 50920]
ESDTAEILSGLTPDGSLTLGTPVCVVVRNKDQRSGDYSEMEAAYRPSHADATYDFKYGIRAIAGGGRASARETVGRVAAGSLAKALLRAANGTEVIAWVSRVKDVEVPADAVDLETVSHASVDSTLVRCPHAETAAAMERAIDEVRTRGNSCGGEVTCLVRRPLRGLGSPVFGKLEADLAAALLSLPACKSFEIGSGAAGSRLLGSQHNDAFESRGGVIRTRTNRSGGVQGGISNGEPILVRVCFKPTATISHEQDTVTREGREVRLRARGRHDPCVLPRAVPIVEAMVALVLADALCQHVGQCRVLEGLKGAEGSAA